MQFLGLTIGSLGIIIPAYNEERRIGATLEKYGIFSKSLDWEILVVINNSTDKTEEIVRKISRKYKNISYIDLIHGGQRLRSN